MYTLKHMLENLSEDALNQPATAFVVVMVQPQAPVVIRAGITEELTKELFKMLSEPDFIVPGNA